MFTLTRPHRPKARQLLLGLLVLALLSITMPSGAQAAGRSWSQGDQTDPFTSGIGAGGQLNSISCPAATQCTAVDDAGNEVTYNPSTDTIPPPVNLLKYAAATTNVGNGGNQAVKGMWVSCPSTSQCTALSVNGFEVTFDPNGLSGIQTVQLNARATVGNPMTALTCPSLSECLATYGDTALVFNPTSPTGAGAISLSADGFVEGVSCGSPSLCSVVGSNGYVTTIDLSNQAAQTTASVVASGDDTISCFATSTTPDCVAADTSEDEALFPENSPGSASDGTIGVVQASSLSCLSTTFCGVVGATGDFSDFTPGSSAGQAEVSLDVGHDLTSIDCTSSTSCAMVDSSGRVVTLNPSEVGSTFSERNLDPDSVATGVACPAENQCTQIDNAGTEVTFDPTASPATVSTRTTVDPGPGAVIACPSATQCTTYDSDGYEATFNPQNPANLTDSQVNPTNHFEAMDIACPTTTECTADDFGGWVTFNPQNPGTPTVHTNLADESGVACPSATQCTVIDDYSGQEVTFNPLSVPASLSPVQVDTTLGMQGIACPATTQCTVLDASGDQVTFNPQNPGTITPRTVDTITTNQLNPSDDVVQAESGPGVLTSISCPTTTDCIATDAEGNTLEGNPASTAAWTVVAPAQTAGLVGVSCADIEICVTTDDSGFVSIGQLAAVATAAPTISGGTVSGDTLTEAHGSWSTPPASYSYQWLDCNTAGQSCTTISGATGQTYTLTAGDVGHTIEVQESVKNAGGTSAPSGSAATAVIVALTSSEPGTTSTPAPTPTVKPTRAQLLTELRTVLSSLKGSNSTLPNVEKHRGFTYTVRAPEAGKLVLEWTIKVKKKTEIIASVTVTLTKAKAAKVTIKLNKTGLKLLKNKKLKRLALAEKAVFAGVTSTRPVTLKR